MKKAFTLIELLVVIGILGILIGTLVVSFGGSTEKARTVKCATNMKNLAVAAISVAPPYPHAQSAQYVSFDGSRTGVGICYNVHKGWISYLDQDTKYPLDSPGSFSQCSFASDNEEEVWYALTNGAVWTAVGCTRSTYLCPAFVDACRKVGVNNPGWSYQMSAYFRYEKAKGQAKATKDDVVNTPSRAERRLMFAEIPALELKPKDAKQTGVHQLPPVILDGKNGDTSCDGCLWYKSAGGNESIGFNHRRNRQIVGHVAFADGHVETIIAPKNGNFVELTDWLCEAKDVTYQDGSYEEIKDSLTE